MVDVEEKKKEEGLCAFELSRAGDRAASLGAEGREPAGGAREVGALGWPCRVQSAECRVGLTVYSS